MNSQTERPVRRPENHRSTRSNKSKRYYKQTARVEARRDGKPLIFGWGKHLSHSEKVKIQRRVTWAIAGFIGLLLVGTIVGFWINLNIIIPGLPITSVNGHQIPQSQYRKMVAVKTQLEVNKIYGPHGLTAQSKDLQTQDATQLKNLDKNTVPLEKQIFTQAQVGNDSVTWLQDDELIREWLTTQSTAIQNQVNPSTADVNKALNDLKANIPTSSSYNNFLRQMNISNDDVLAMLTVKARRDNMQNHLASKIGSPAYQVLSRTITTDTQAEANKILQELKNGGDFAKIASKQSKDTTTASRGGSQGWLARGQYA